MPIHTNLVANGPKYKDNMLKYFNSIPDSEKKIDFLYGLVYATANAADVLSNEENAALMEVVDDFRGPVKSEKGGKKEYDLEAAERNFKAMLRRKLQGNLALGKKLRQNINSLPEKTENKEAIAAFQTRSSLEMATADIDDFIFKMLVAGKTEMSSQLRENTGKDWSEHYQVWINEETQAYMSKLKGDDLEDYQNGLDLLGDEPNLLKGKSLENLGLSKDNLDKIRKSSHQQFWNRYGDLSYRNPELYAALDKFNSKRFWGIGSWWSADPTVGKETEEHRDLKNSSRSLIEAIDRYEKVRYLSDISIETKRSYAIDIREKALEVQRDEVTYERQKKATASSPAGKTRMDGARELKYLAISVNLTMEHDIEAYDNEIQASKSIPSVEAEVSKKEESPVKSEAPEKKVTAPVRPVRHFEMQSTGQVEILGKSAAQANSILNVGKQPVPSVPNDPGFDLSKVTIYPEMRSLMLKYAEMAQNSLNNKISSVVPNELTESLKKIASQKGTENLQEFKDACDEVTKACKSYQGNDEGTKELIQEVEQYQQATKDYINQRYYKKIDLALKANDGIDKTIEDYGKVLKSVREVVNTGDNSPQIKNLEESILKITQSGPDVTRYELVTLAQDVTSKSADFPADPKYDKMIQSCIKAENRLNNRLTKLNLAETASKERDDMYQKMVDDYVSKSKPQKTNSEVRTSRNRSRSMSQPHKDKNLKPAMTNSI